MNYLQAPTTDTGKNTIKDESLSTYMPPRIVLSSQISRNDLCKNIEGNETQGAEKLDDTDEFFENLSEQMQGKIKEYKENKNHLKIKPLSKKRKNFVSEFLEVKKRFEADFTANTRIYHSSSQSLINSKTVRDLNNEEYKLQMSSADKYVAMLEAHKTAQRPILNKVINKHYLLQNWVPGAVMTKIKVNLNSNSNDFVDSIENEALLKNSVNNQELKIRKRKDNGTFYTFTYAAASRRKAIQKKKTSFIEEFSELRDKLGVLPKKNKKEQEENSPLINSEIKEGLYSSPLEKKRTNKINNRIITPFNGFKTSFFSNFNSTETDNSEKISDKKQGNVKRDITADWVKGDLVKREENMTFIDAKNWEQTPERMYDSEDLSCNVSSNYFFQNNKSHEEKSEFDFTPRTIRNDYSKMSASYTPVDESHDNTKNKRIFENQCTSAVTMSNTVQYSRNANMSGPNVVITQTKVTKLTLFPLHQVNLFR